MPGLRPPRALYVELKRRYNDSNSGHIVLSHRQAAETINVHRNTMGAWFKELMEWGFIHMTQEPHLGHPGIGLSALWALDEVPTETGTLAHKAYMRWQPTRLQRESPAQDLCRSGTFIMTPTSKVGPSRHLPSQSE